jgi:DNA-binding transcriptional MerR regulator
MKSQDQHEIPRHPIGVVTRRTGLSPHVLRAWERRYGVVQPQRGDSGRRLYSDRDVERLSLLQGITCSGRPLASVVGLSVESLRALVAEDAEHEGRGLDLPGVLRERAIEAVAALDTPRLEALLRRALLSLGAVTYLEEVVSPLLAEIGSRWHAGTLGIAQEHAATATVQRQLGTLIRELEDPDAGLCVVVATPLGERHTLGALQAAAVAACDGWKVIWLGADLPAAQIVAGAAQGGASLLALSVAGESDVLKDELLAMRQELPAQIPLAVGGPGAAGARGGRGITIVRDLAHWRVLLRVHASGGRE